LYAEVHYKQINKNIGVSTGLDDSSLHLVSEMSAAYIRGRFFVRLLLHPLND